MKKYVHKNTHIIMFTAPSFTRAPSQKPPNAKRKVKQSWCAPMMGHKKSTTKGTNHRYTHQHGWSWNHYVKWKPDTTWVHMCMKFHKTMATHGNRTNPEWGLGWLQRGMHVRRLQERETVSTWLQWGWCSSITGKPLGILLNVIIPP